MLRFLNLKCWMMSLVWRCLERAKVVVYDVAMAMLYVVTNVVIVLW